MAPLPTTGTLPLLSLAPGEFGCIIGLVLAVCHNSFEENKFLIESKWLCAQNSHLAASLKLSKRNAHINKEKKERVWREEGREHKAAGHSSLKVSRVA